MCPAFSRMMRCIIVDTYDLRGHIGNFSESETQQTGRMFILNVEWEIIE